MVLLSSTHKYEHMRRALNEKQWRQYRSVYFQYLALEAKEQGNILQIATLAGVSRNTVRRGITEVESGDLYTPGERVRRKGAGGKYLKDTDTTLVSDLEALVEPIRGIPLRSQPWQSCSHRLVSPSKPTRRTLKESPTLTGIYSSIISTKPAKYLKVRGILSFPLTARRRN